MYHYVIMFRAYIHMLARFSAFADFPTYQVINLVSYLPSNYLITWDDPLNTRRSDPVLSLQTDWPGHKTVEETIEAKNATKKWNYHTQR